jgi:hypothetical protein
MPKHQRSRTRSKRVPARKGLKSKRSRRQTRRQKGLRKTVDKLNAMIGRLTADLINQAGAMPNLLRGIEGARMDAFAAPAGGGGGGGGGASTVDKVKGIVRSHGIVAHPNETTIVGPAVVSMGTFTDQVNSVFGKAYTNELKAGWTIQTTSKFIDTH